MFLFLENTCGCVLGPWPRLRAFLSLASRRSVLGKAVLGLGLGFFLCPWPWSQALCPRLHLYYLGHPICGRIKVLLLRSLQKMLRMPKIVRFCRTIEETFPREVLLQLLARKVDDTDREWVVKERNSKRLFMVIVTGNPRLPVNLFS